MPKMTDEDLFAKWKAMIVEDAVLHSRILRYEVRISSPTLE